MERSRKMFQLKKNSKILSIVIITVLCLSFASLNSYAATYTNYPEAVVCTPHGDLKTSVGFAWYTNTEVMDSVVQLRVAGDSRDFGTDPNLTFTGTCETISYGELTYNVHKVVATGLRPGTKYEYRVGAQGYWSDAEESLNGVGYFETAPESEEEFTFINIGDLNISSEGSARAFGNALQRVMNLFPTAKFITQNGDTAEDTKDNGKKENQWEYIFHYAQPYLKNTIWIGAIGNHDNVPDDSVYRQHFNYKPVDNNGLYFSFDYSNVHFLVLDTNNNHQKQVDWALYDVVKNNKKWNIAFFHKPLYSNGNHYMEESVRKVWQTPLCDILGIDIMFTGHDHVYNRGYYLKDRLPVSDEINKEEGEENIVTDPIGTLFVLPNCAASKFYTPKEENLDYIKVSAQPNKSTYAGVTVTNDTLKYKVYCYDSETGTDVLLDQFGMRKTKLPPPAPQNVKISFDKANRTALITWEDTNTENVRGYVIYDENNKYREHWTYFTKSADVKSYTITGLTEETFKECRFAVKSVGDKSFSEAAIAIDKTTEKGMNVKEAQYFDRSLGKVLVKGQVEKDDVEDQVTLVLYKNKQDGALNITEDDIAYIGQTTIDREGNYVFKFPFNDDINNYTLKIYKNNELINSTVTEAVADYSWLDAKTQIFKANDFKVVAESIINNYCDVEGLTYTICLAFYDNNNKLLEVKNNSIKNIGDGVTTDNLYAAIPERAVKVTAIIWSNYRQMIPLCESDTMFVK